MRSRLLFFTLLSAISWAGVSPAAAQSDGRSGREVVDEVCAKCHASGANGAPRIGDTDAWSPRAARGLASLTESAVKGVRNMRVHGGSPTQWRPTTERAVWREGDMPARGGSPGLSDLEIQRAITYMVNMSGGSWGEPEQ
jgi:cytochrome c5